MQDRKSGNYLTSLWRRCSIKKFIWERSHWCNTHLPLFAFVRIFMDLPPPSPLSAKGIIESHPMYIEERAG